MSHTAAQPPQDCAGRYHQLLLLNFLGSALFLVLMLLYEAVGITQINAQLTKLV